MIRRRKTATKLRHRLLVLAGFGLLLAALACNIFIGQRVDWLPRDFQYTADITSGDNFYNAESGVFSGVLHSNTTLKLTTTGNSGNTLAVHDVFDVISDSGKRLVKIERNYAVDRATGAHTQGGDKNRSGYLFAPQNLKKGQSFTYWHVNYDRPVVMHYVDNEPQQGLETFHYEAKFDADQTKELGFLPGVPQKRGIIAHVTLSLWVDPVTGWLVNYKDVTEANYYDQKTKQEVQPWNKFSNTFTQASTSDQISHARALQQNKIIFEYVLPGIILVIALLLMVGSQIDWSNFVRWSPFLVPSIGLVVTFAATGGTLLNQQYQQHVADTSHFSKFETVVQNRIQAYDNALYATQAFYRSSQFVSQQGWQTFTKLLNIQTHLPGAQGLGLALKVGDKADVASFESKYRAILGDANFTITPMTDRKEYYAIVYIEPLDDRNKAAVGYDMYTEPVRRAAMSRAIDSGSPEASGKVTLLQEITNQKQAGFLLYLPLYKKGAPTNNIAERRQAIEGFVYMPFRVGDFFTGVFGVEGDDLAFKVYAGDVAEKNLLFSHKHDDNEFRQAPLITSVQDIEGQKWTFQYYRSSKDYALTSTDAIVYVLMIGLTITGLLTWLAFVLRSSNARAYRLAESITADIRADRENLRLAVNKSILAEKKTEEVKRNLLEQNKELEDNKLAMLNVLEDLDEERENLSEAKAKDEAVLQSIGDGLVTIDAKGVITLINRTFEKSLGLKERDVIGKRFYDVVKLYDQTKKPVADRERITERALQAGETVSLSPNELAFYKDTSGRFFPVAITISPIKIRDTIIGAVEIFRDITTEKEIDKAKTEFVSLASHQLRTPLSTISWYAEMLLEGDAGKINEEQKKYLDEIYTGNHRMTELVSALLNVSRIDLGTFSVDPEPVNIVELAQQIVKDLEPRIFARQQDFQESYAKNIPTMNVDPKLTRIVIENLCSNAVKYTPKGGKISLKLSAKEKSVVIAVEDNGYGIPASQKDKIFTKLFRADNIKTQDTEGTGLGLYLVKSIIDYSGGKIWFESKEDEGTTFYVELPLDGMKEKKGSKHLD